LGSTTGLTVLADDKVAVLSDTEKSVETGRFAQACCSYLEFHFRAARDKFSLADFVGFMKAGGFPRISQRWAGACLTQFQKETDYHVHFGLNEADDKELELLVSYHRGSIPPSENEKEPFAEQFMAWIGQFFAAGYANADIRGQISYPAMMRQSRYLLPVKVAIVPGLDTTIDGISIDFPSRPNGVDTARLTVGAKSINISLGGAVKVNFGAFDVYEYLSNVSLLALGLTDIRKPV
jgi:hypothetical protein